MKGVRRGCVRLKGAVIGIDDQDVNTFTITVDHKTFHFQSKDGEEREKWVRRLEDTILRHANRNRGIWSSDPHNYGLAYGSTELSKRPNYLQTLDKRINEADAYLQLMIEQTNKIEAKIAAAAAAATAATAATAALTSTSTSAPTTASTSNSSNVSNDGDNDKEKKEPRDANKAIQENANAMLESFKHSIVLLQIAKNTAHPINGIYQGPSIQTNPKGSISQGNTTPDSADTVSKLIGPTSLPTGIEFGTDCLKKKMDGSSLSADNSLLVPDTSYSSSEGEDDFYDATENPYSSQSSIKDDVEAGDLPPVIKKEISNPRNSLTPYRIDGSLDYDALYEDETENDISMESHGSVVTHLLSQVKIGMDLTKVVLPTFILERRSLLEMYADYFAHPDLFLRIADMKEPRDRMVQVVKWYVSSYHAGRKSAVAKKPYNPILGEVFQCHWDLPPTNGQQPDGHLVSDGPVPWCRNDQLTFVAEQVCHHPPSKLKANCRSHIVHNKVLMQHA